MKYVFIVLTLYAGLIGLSNAQELAYPDSFNEPMELFPDAMGDFFFPISSENDLAQAYFNQGFQLMYSFAKEDAVRSFQASHLADPDCAVCWWGESWAWGSYLNGAMTSAQAPRAYFALKQALLRIDSANEKEADMIRALEVRYIENFDPANRRLQDKDYADAMGELAKKYPDDLDLPLQRHLKEKSFMLQSTTQTESLRKKREHKYLRKSKMSRHNMAFICRLNR